jgi:FAD/FMN-containing dehydrogenase
MTSAYTTIEQELTPLVKGDCFFDEETREAYSTAASWYKIQPVGVLFPCDVEDVQAAVRFCRESGLAIIPRGGGTGLAGQAVGFGLILDFTKHMNRVISTGPSSVTVQPGLILQDLNQRLAANGRMFPVDPASAKLCTVGGMIATNAAGAHGLKYGATKDHIERLTVVLSNGDVAVIEQDRISASSESVEMFEQIGSLLRSHRELVEERYPRVAKNSSGYNLLDAIRGSGLDARKLLAGSEGTLGIVVEATLNHIPIPAYRAGVLAYFADYESTAHATVNAQALRPSAIEILDRTYFTLGRGASPSTDALLRDDALAMLYFEFEGNEERAVTQAAQELERLIQASPHLHVLPLALEEDRRLLWELRENVSRALNLDESLGKTSFIEDVAVPVQQLPVYLRSLTEILERYGIQFSMYGHAGTGNIHCAAFVDLRNLSHYRAIDRIASEVNDLAVSLGGTLSGEHGDGFVRTPFLERLYGAEVYWLFREVKRILDPRNIFNPGKIVGPQNTTILHDLPME